MVDYERMAREGVEKELFRFCSPASRPDGMSLYHEESPLDLLFNQIYLNPNAYRYVLQKLVDQE